LEVSQGEFTVPFIVFIVLIGHELDKDRMVFTSGFGGSGVVGGRISGIFWGYG
jgi:hypothetical protein